MTIRVKSIGWQRHCSHKISRNVETFYWRNYCGSPSVQYRSHNFVADARPEFNLESGYREAVDLLRARQFAPRPRSEPKMIRQWFSISSYLSSFLPRYFPFFSSLFRLLAIQLTFLQIFLYKKIIFSFLRGGGGYLQMFSKF